MSIVTRVQFATPEGRLSGIGTRVVLADGFQITFVGPMTKKAAVANATYQRDRGTASEAATPPVEDFDDDSLCACGSCGGCTCAL